MPPTASRRIFACTTSRSGIEFETTFVSMSLKSAISAVKFFSPPIIRMVQPSLASMFKCRTSGRGENSALPIRVIPIGIIAADEEFFSQSRQVEGSWPSSDGRGLSHFYLLQRQVKGVNALRGFRQEGLSGKPEDKIAWAGTCEDLPMESRLHTLMVARSLALVRGSKVCNKLSLGRGQT